MKRYLLLVILIMIMAVPGHAADTTFTDGEGIDSNDSGGSFTVGCEDASTSNKGCASFDSGDFSISSGAVSINSADISDDTNLAVAAPITLTGDTVGFSGAMSDLSDVGTTTPTSGNLMIADGTNFDSVAMGGDATINSNGTVTVGNAGTADALTSNGSNCSAGNYPLGVDASGAVENCTADDDVPEVGDFTNLALTGDVSSSGLTTTIASNSVDGTMIAVGSDAQGDILYYNGTDWARLAAGSNGEFLQTQGAGANPQWTSAPSGSSALGDLTDTGDTTATSGHLLIADGSDFVSVSMSGDTTVTSAGVVTIDDDKILERMFKAVDAASDEECLTYETTTGDFEWQTCGGGGSTVKHLNSWTAKAAELPASSFATLDVRNNRPVLDYSDATDELATFSGVLPEYYAGGGVTVTLGWMATTATTNAVCWSAAIASVTDDADDIDGSIFATAKTASCTTATATGEVDYCTISFSNGAEMDSLAAGEYYNLQIMRDGDGTACTDSMTDTAELLFVSVEEQ